MSFGQPPVLKGHEKRDRLGLGIYGSSNECPYARRKCGFYVVTTGASDPNGYGMFDKERVDSDANQLFDIRFGLGASRLCTGLPQNLGGPRSRADQLSHTRSAAKSRTLGTFRKWLGRSTRQIPPGQPVEAGDAALRWRASAYRTLGNEIDEGMVLASYFLRWLNVCTGDPFVTPHCLDLFFGPALAERSPR